MHPGILLFGYEWVVIGGAKPFYERFIIAEEVPDNATDHFITQSLNGQMGWRRMFWAEAVPSLIFLILVFFIPESPRYLAKIGNTKKSFRILEKIGRSGYAGTIEENIAETLNSSSVKFDWKTLKSSKIRPVLILGIVLAVFQ